MPARLRPTAPIAADAILVGDPGRALLLAQELLQEPKMSNHARGLWGYSGATAAGKELTIQSTGMGGPSAGVVLRDLAELGVRRAIRVGTGTSLGDLSPGAILVVEAAQRSRGSFRTVSVRKEPRDWERGDEGLTGRLREALPEARVGTALSLDNLHDPERGSPSSAAEVADMQTATLLATAQQLELPLAALLIVTETREGEVLGDTELEAAAKAAGVAAAQALST